MICPQTGSMSSSLLISGDLSSTHAAATAARQQQVGISSVSMYPPRIYQKLHPNRLPLALVYGGKISPTGAAATKDCVAMMISLSSHNPKVHWKARLPEAHLSAGVVVTLCGHYVVGGGKSGTLYVWSTLTGDLLNTFHRAHYRPITCLHMVQDYRHVLTGGADGMVHLFALMDLVQDNSTSTKSSQTVVPIRTWSQHQVPITCLAPIADTDCRVVSASEDGVLHVLETFSEVILATVQFPQGISSMATRGSRIWVGGSLGTIFCLDMDLYAMHQTMQFSGSRIARGASSSITAFLDAEQSANSNTPSYQTTLLGHSDPITSMAIWKTGEYQDEQEFLASGDASGTLRIWDLSARVCVQVVRPWSSPAAAAPAKSSSGKAAAEKNQKKTAAPRRNPITSIHVVEIPEATTDDAETMASGGGAGKQKGGASAWTSFLPALSKYAPATTEAADGDPDKPQLWTPVPLWNYDAMYDSDSDEEGSSFWDVSNVDYGFDRLDWFKRPGTAASTGSTSKSDNPPAETAAEAKSTVKDPPPKQENNSNDDKEEELEQLRKQLEEANATIARWEKVNNQLVSKLQTATKTKKK